VPRVEQLVGYHIGVTEGKELDSEEQGNGGPVVVKVWSLVFTDRQSGDQIRIAFRQDTRDEIVRQLTGGIVLAGGELPKL
jgi:hypothetical protein